MVYMNSSMLHLQPQISVHRSFVAVDAKNNNNLLVKINAYSDRNARKGGTGRNATSGNMISCNCCLENSCGVGIP